MSICKGYKTGPLYFKVKAVGHRHIILYAAVDLLPSLEQL